LPLSITSRTRRVARRIGLDRDARGRRRARDSIFDRVLDDRLEDQRGHERRVRARRDVEPHDQILVAQLLDLEIGPLQLDLGGERDLVGRVGGKPEAAGSGRACDHLVGPGDAPVEHQRGDRVQTVEQEVRVDLAVQRAKLGACARSRISAGRCCSSRTSKL
jgi:hypothetical protein